MRDPHLTKHGCGWRMAHNLLQKSHNQSSVSGIHIKVEGRNPLICLLHVHSSMSLPIMPTHAFTCMNMYMHTHTHICKSNWKESSLHASEETSENLFCWSAHVGAVMRLSLLPGPLTGLTYTFLQYFSLHHRWVECVPFQSSRPHMKYVLVSSICMPPNFCLHTSVV